jgi:hypothetical protein
LTSSSYSRRYGIKTTAGVVTSAAVVLVAVFSVFATSRRSSLARRIELAAQEGGDDLGFGGGAQDSHHVSGESQRGETAITMLLNVAVVGFTRRPWADGRAHAASGALGGS